MREQGRTDKELSGFLVVSKEEVLKICQSGLRTSNSIKKEPQVMRELGNPQRGVYLFRHIDIALNYASKHSPPIENIIIFRVLLGKVKKINPPKGKKKVPLDPTPNYDCHVSKIHPSLKDSIEDQAIGSLVYFYEYSELSKPVDKPRQCLPHAVVKVKCINQIGRADHPVVPFKSRPKSFFKGRGRGLPLENCTVVTRIGNSQLIYEHFHKPKNCAVSDNLFVDYPPNWGSFGAETQASPLQHKLPGRWDLTLVEGSSSNNSNDAFANYGGLSTVITSKSIKDPRLAKKERNLGEPDGEPVSHETEQLENELKYQTEMKMPATFGIPWPDPDKLFLLNDSWHTFSEEQPMAKTPWEDWVSGEHRSPLHSIDEYSVNNEHSIVNVNQLNRDVENLASDFNLNFQVKCSLTESQVLKIEHGKEELGDVSDPALITECKGLATEDTAYMLLTSAPVPLECAKDPEIEHPWSENTSHSTNEKCGVLNSSLSCNNSVPEIFEQEVVKCRDINTPDLEDNSKTEFVSVVYKKCSSTPQKLCTHIEVSSEDTDFEYQYLQERMDWENLLATPSPNTDISESTSTSPKEDKKECSCEGKIELGREGTKMFNVHMSPDLQITVANTLHPCHGSLKMRTEVEKSETKPSEQRTDTKLSQKKKKQKYIPGQKSSRLYHRKKVLNTHWFKRALPLARGQFKTFEQSEKHIKNVLHTLNTEASLCKNKHLSQKINGAMLHLQKAQISVQKSLKILAKTRKKKRKNYSRTHKTALSNSLESSDCASYATSLQNTAACFTRRKSPTISLLAPPIEIGEDDEKTNCQLECHIESKGDMTNSTTSFFQDNESQSESLHLEYSVASVFVSDMPSSSNNESVREVDHGISEKAASSDAMGLGDVKPASGESGVNRELKAFFNWSENIQEHLSPVTEETKQELSSKPNKNNVTSKNISQHSNLATGTEELSLCCAGQGTDDDAYEYDENISKVKLATSVQKPLGKLMPSKPGDSSPFPIFSGKDPFPNEKEAAEISTPQQKNISVDSALASDTRDPQVLLTPQMHGSRWKTATNNFSKGNLEEICSEIWQKADKTSYVNVLEDCSTVCRSILPSFIRAFEEKQDCSFEHVLVSRENAEKSMRAKLKPSAIESFVELQIIMETIEFLENKRRYLEGKRTFRSLLWFDDSLCIELFGGQSGYQQQSNFYPAFQRSLKYNALSELQSHHKELVEKFEVMRLESKSYYCLLKVRREIKECEAAVKSNSPLSDFFLSEPYSCGANYGDTVEDLEKARRNTVDLINICLSGIPLGTEKLEHLGIIMDIISTKIEFIRTCEEKTIKSSFIGLEHIFFDAAVNCILRERSAFVNGDFESGEEQMLQIYEAALPKLYEIYEDKVEKLERNLNCVSEEHILRKSVEQHCSCEKVGGGTNYQIGKYLVSYPEICVGEILDEAPLVNLEKLRQHLCRCTEHLEVLKKYFQIIQEVDINSVLITKENVLSFMESSGLKAIRLKPEAVEVYMDLAMVHETLGFLQNSIAIKEDKPRFRSLLWFDLSLVNELFHCQQKMASFSYQKDNPLAITESTISDLQNELNVVYEYAESLNCSYACQLLTKELEELLETRKYLQTSESSICMCVDVVPYTIALNYGSNISDLEYNYEQFYSLFEKLLLTDRKDLGKMAHVMKILKTIEHMKFLCTKQQKPPLHLVICQMLKNWRKSHQLKKHDDMKRHVDANGSNSPKHKRPAGITAEDSCSGREQKNDPSDCKKKKVAASLMTTKKKQEEESHRNVRVGARPKPLENEELPVWISTDTSWKKKDKCLSDRPFLPPSHSEGLKAADSLDCAEFSPNASCLTIVNSNMLDNQKNHTDLKDFSDNRSGCSEENKQECIAPCSASGKGTSVSPNKDPSLLLQDSFTSVAKLSHDSPVLPTLDQHYDAKPDVTRNVSGLMPRGCAAAPLELDRNGEVYGEKSEPSDALACNSDSSAIPELNKFMELESPDPFPTENTQTTAESPAFGQNEPIEGTPHIPSYPMHTYRIFYPSHSWHFWQTGSSYHVTQTYQEFSSYETHQVVYNVQSSTFYSQSCSRFGVGESQRFNFAQAHPVQSCFSSEMPFPDSHQQWPLWHTERLPTAQAGYPYSSNTGW